MSDPHRIVVLALPGVMPFELAIPGRLFGSALDPAGQPLYEVITCSVDGGPVGSGADYDIAVRYGQEALADADTVVIPPSHALDEVLSTASLPPPIAAALRRIRPGTRLMAMCTGAFVLAAAGALDGRRAVTHWAEAASLAALFPSVAVDQDALYIDEGDVLTSAGIAAGIDLCMHVIRRDYGTQVAAQVARECVISPQREGGQRQFTRRPVPAPARGSTTSARAWALDRLAEPLTLTVLADRATMSVRTFTRRFREETGLSPGEWLAAQRLDYARTLLEGSDLAVDQVAARSGLGTGANLRQQFRAALGVSPAAYRRTFHQAA
jgi:transcriptional regulator GlxA family with amidase domain